MLKSTLPEDQKQLIVAPQDPAVVLVEDEEDPLSLVLPPSEEISEIGALRESLVSLGEQAAGKRKEIEVEFKAALEFEKRKLTRFGRSPVFLNRLANLAAAAGEYEQESQLLDAAIAQSSNRVLLHRKGDNLLARHRVTEAEEVFQKLDLSDDLYANLKLATFLVRRHQFDDALQYVERAVDINPASYAARLFDGGLRLVRKEFERAIHSFRIAADEKPTSSVLFSNLAAGYLALGQKDKALSALKRAVALNPLNVNAVLLLADTAYHLKRDEEAVPSLRYLLALEQKQAGGWARLARSLLQLGQIREAVDALKHEASVNETSAVWNNLGVAYGRLRDPERALRSFKRAFELGEERKNADYFLAARNIAQVLAQKRTSQPLLKFTEAVLAEDIDGLCLGNVPLADLYAFYLHALRMTGKRTRLVSESEAILEDQRAGVLLKAWVLMSLIGVTAFNDQGSGLLNQVIEKHSETISSIVNSSEDPYKMYMFYNNMAFALAEGGRTADAEWWLGKISKCLHKEAYSTATLGLIDMRRGNIERGRQRYQEAIRLALQRSDKTRIKQKFYFELARYWKDRDSPRSRRLLEKIVAITDGEAQLRLRAEQLLAESQRIDS